MEIPRIYRETRARVEFAGFIKKDEKSGFVYFKYPGGEIPYINGEDFFCRLIDKGFGEAEIDKIINLLVSAVATEATVASREVAESFL